MKKVSLARKLMLPLSDYGSVSLDDTLLDALRALAKAQVSVAPGRSPHRALLVTRADGVCVGKLGYRAILSAIRPEQMSVEMDGMMRRAGVSEDMLSSSLASMELLAERSPNVCDRACCIKISELVLTPPRTIDVEAELHELLDEFVNHPGHSVLVLEKGDVVGVVRISDLFDEVTRIALEEYDGEPGAGEGGAG